MPSIPCDPVRGGAEEPARSMSEPEFEALFRAHFDFVYRNLARLGVPQGAVEDAAQEVFLVALRRGGSVVSMRAWLFGIVRRIAWRYRRGSARRVRLENALSVAAPPPTDGPAAVAEREARALLEAFLGRLDEDKRAVFLLAELEQMTAKEIAATLSVKENTVYSRLRAARQAFDRTFSRLRRAERRALGESAGDERGLRLSQARRAHEPKPASRQRAWVALIGAPGGGGGLVPGAAVIDGGSPLGSVAGAGGAGASPAITAPAKVGLMGSLGLGGGGAKAFVAAGVGLASLLLVAPSITETEEVGPESSSVSRGGAKAEVRPARAGEVDASQDPNTPELPEDAEPGAALAGRGGVEPGPFAALERAKARGAARPQESSAMRRQSRAEKRGEEVRGTSARRSENEGEEARGGAAEGRDGERLTERADDRIRREVEMMGRARAEIRARAWTRAKMMLERHARHFPEGSLAEERHLSMVSVLCAMGDVVGAQAEVDRIRTSAPHSALVGKALALCPGLS